MSAPRSPNPSFVIGTYRTIPLPFSPIMVPYAQQTLSPALSPVLPAMHKTPPSLTLKPAAARAFWSDPYRTHPLSPAGVPPLSLPPLHPLHPLQPAHK
jgi:hypothetical protein